ncbi:MAG: hypothetical protein WAK24_20900 [Candidatus Acidiferrales bacterium]
MGFLVTKEFKIGNFKFQMEETANASDDAEVRASYTTLSTNPNRPGEPGLMSAAASRRTPDG